MKSVVFSSRAGCLLPLLIILNLLFGWRIFKPLEWLAVGAVLALLFIFNSIVVARQVFPRGSSRRSGAIDVEAEVMEGDNKLKEGH